MFLEPVYYFRGAFTAFLLEIPVGMVSCPTKNVNIRLVEEPGTCTIARQMPKYDKRRCSGSFHAEAASCNLIVQFSHGHVAIRLEFTY